MDTQTSKLAAWFTGCLLGWQLSRILPLVYYWWCDYKHRRKLRK